MTPRVLVVDDDEQTRMLLVAMLKESGMQTVEAGDGEDALTRFYEYRPDLVILDISMPGIDGVEVLRRIRDMSDAPVIMLTSNEAERDEARSLNAGADDYVTKPFGAVELEARVRAVLRRTKRERADDADLAGDALIAVDTGQGIAKISGREVQMTPREFSLLAALVARPNQVLRHEQLIELVWGGDGSSGSREQLKVYVRRLREKIHEAAGADPIETVRGFGYRYLPPS